MNNYTESQNISIAKQNEKRTRVGILRKHDFVFASCRLYKNTIHFDGLSFLDLILVTSA